MSSGFRTKCPECSAVFRLQDESAIGKRMKCKKCGHAFTIRSQSAKREDEDSIYDDYGDTENATTTHVPRTRAKPKKKRKSKPFPWVLVVVVALVPLAGWAGYQAIQIGISAASGSGVPGFATMFDSHEALIDEALTNYQKLEGILGAIQTQDDIPTAVEKIADIQQRTEQHDERLLALGEITSDRSRELTKYWNAGHEQRQAAVNRLQVQFDRLKSAGLMTDDLSFDLALFRAKQFNFDLVRQLPEPDASRSKEVYFYERTQALRQSMHVLTKMKDDGSAAAQIEELKTATAALRELLEKTRQREFQRATSNAGSPYFAPHLVATTTISDLSSRVRKRVTNTEAIKAVDELDGVISNLAFADMGAPGPAGPVASVTPSPPPVITDPGQPPVRGGVFPPNGGTGAPSSQTPVPGRGGPRPFSGGGSFVSPENQRARFIERAGGPEQVVTINFTNEDITKVRDFQKKLSELKLSKGSFSTPQFLIFGCSQPLSEVAKQLDFVDVVSVDDAQRTLTITLPE